MVNSLDREIKVHFNQSSRANEIMETLADISKAKKVLNWIPKTSFEAGIREIMTHMKIIG